MTEFISLTINGLHVQAQQGTTILEAASRAGMFIPTLCYCPDVSSAGACRICLVRILGKKKLYPACRTPVFEGMEVVTDDPVISHVRRITLELLLSDHDFNCLLCSKNGTCRLQALVNRVGFEQRRLDRFDRIARQAPVDNSNPFITFNPNKCIQCGICVRTCDEISGVNALDMAFRGYELKVATFGDKPLKDSACVSCGECVERCPTAALVRKQDIFPTREVKTTCAYCGVGCGLYLGVQGGRVVRARGDRSNPVNRGELCVRGRFGYRFIHSPSRLKTPLVRAYDPFGPAGAPRAVADATAKRVVAPVLKQGNRFVEVTWEQALNYVASTLVHYKGDQFAAISSAKCTNEENYLFQKFARAAMGTNNIDHCARL